MDAACQRLFAVMLAGWIGWSAGCAGRNGGQPPSDVATAQPQVSLPSSANFGGQASADAPTVRAVAAERAPEEPEDEGFFRSAGSAISASFASTSEKIADALTIKPRVVGPQDPTRLSSTTKELGPGLYISSAELAASQRDYNRAEVQYKKALDLEPENLRALLALSRLKHMQGDMKEAARLAHRAAEVDPKNPVVHNDLGLCYARQQRPREAIAAFSQAIALRPDNKMYRNNMATVLVEAGRPQEAFSHLLAAHREAVAHYNLGYLLFKRGEREQASRAFENALKADPEMKSARAMLARVAPQRGSTAAVAIEPARRQPPGLSASRDGMLPPIVRMDPSSLDGQSGTSPAASHRGGGTRPGGEPHAAGGTPAPRSTPVHQLDSGKAQIAPLEEQRYSTQYPFEPSASETPRWGGGGEAELDPARRGGPPGWPNVDGADGGSTFRNSLSPSSRGYERMPDVPPPGGYEEGPTARPSGVQPPYRPGSTATDGESYNRQAAAIQMPKPYHTVRLLGEAFEPPLPSEVASERDALLQTTAPPKLLAPVE